MFYLNKKQKSIKELIKKFGCLRTDQIENITNLKKIDDIMKPVLKQWNSDIKKEDDLYLCCDLKNINKRLLKALDVYSYLSKSKEPIEWCEIVNFPFEISFFRNEKVFDVAVIGEGEETFYCSAINRSIGERIILVLDSALQVDKLSIKKQCKICLLKPEIKFFDFNKK